MKKVLVTGAAGFIGSHVVRLLLEDNVEVRAFVKPDEPTDNIDGLDMEIVFGDLLDKAAVEKAVAGVDTVFHLAAIFSIWMKDWKYIYEVNLTGSRNVLWAARNAGVNRVVYTSSIAAIGTTPGMGLSSEKTPFNQYDLGNHYILTKYLSQQEALGFAENGLDVVVVNPCFPFGPGDIAPTPTGQIILDVISQKAQFYFDGGLNIVDVRDVARGHILAAKKGKTGQTYILGNKNVTMQVFIDMVRKEAGLPTKKLPKLPVKALTAGAHAMKWWADNVSGKKPLASPSDLKYTAQYLFFDTTKVQKELGLSLTPVEQSLENSISWFRERGYASV